MKKGVLLSILASCIFNSNAIETESLFSNPLTSKPQQLFRTQASGSLLSLLLSARNHGGVITISGPEGFSLSQPFSEQSLSLNLLDSTERLPAGRYDYQVTAHVGALQLIQDTLDNGRGDENFTYAGTPVSISGSFVVESGSIVQYSQIKEDSYSEW